MDAILFALTLEVMLQQLIIHEGSTELRLSCKAADKRKGKMQYDKLVRDRDIVKDVVKRTLIEVAERGEWSSLQKAVDVLEELVLCAVAKRDDHERLILTRKEIMSQLNSKRIQWKVHLRSADQKVAFLRDKMKNDQQNAAMRVRYAEAWLCARAEALEMKFQIQRANMPPLPRADHEERVHKEICKAIELQINEREKASEHWRERYGVDTARMDVLLEEKRRQLSVAAAKHAELQALYDLHAGEIRSWLSFKEQRAARLAREERVRVSATRIQAWWRGVMVRRALGPFKHLKNVKKSPSKSKKK
ncbi:dynein regulatory complex protein 9-like [Pectinophora gossypiella]|uniref:dynein regulatory complex protein 9-like n=1 Tax=Pectinophora gossypiella TaxID=13191 RepID=UPI00214EF7C3|nr:dynein regulatory complex protein 9-like [Pectinophora gossypiella]